MMSPAVHNAAAANGDRTRPLKIDLHTHVLPREWPDLEKKFGYPGWITMNHGDDPTKATMMLDGKKFREINCNCWDNGARLADCERTDVDVQVSVFTQPRCTYPRGCANMRVLLIIQILVGNVKSVEII